VVAAILWQTFVKIHSGNGLTVPPVGHRHVVIVNHTRRRKVCIFQRKKCAAPRENGSSPRKVFSTERRLKIPSVGTLCTYVEAHERPNDAVFMHVESKCCVAQQCNKESGEHQLRAGRRRSYLARATAEGEGRPLAGWHWARVLCWSQRRFCAWMFLCNCTGCIAPPTHRPTALIRYISLH
jgi:hypothetical protein